MGEVGEKGAARVEVIASVLTEHEWSTSDDFCNCGHYVGARMPSVHKWHLADVLTDVADNKGTLTGIIRSVTDLWDEPLDEVHDVPQIVNALIAAGCVIPLGSSER